ncbi:helix-turn-helix transcriptional regulator [Curtobacterium sp. 1544]|uniref:helix-turn-helix domain-containing protein n=1 Tax=Curtobacterium sp. 1544 TaxID=3156417 RepID=UPI003398B71E
MAEQQAAHLALEWDLADRMRKALRSSGVSNNEMAEYLGVSRNSVSAWINGTSEPRLAHMRLFALRTGAPFDWLTTGVETENAPGPDGGTEGDSRFGGAVRSKGLEPPTF